MIEAGINKRVKIGQLVESLLPSYIVAESPKTIDFLKQYYLTQDSQGGVSDIIENLDQYLKFDNLTPDVIKGKTTLSSSISSTDTTITLASTRGLPKNDGLIKVGSEIIYYKEVSGNDLTGCARGFSGVTDYKNGEVVFQESSASSHSSDTTVTNLSVLFLKEFFRNLKVSFAPGFEDETFVSTLNLNNFVKNLRSFYTSKGTLDSFKILISALFGKESDIKNQADLLIQSSTANFKRRVTIVAEKVSGDPLTLTGKTLIQDANANDPNIDGASAPISEVEFITKRGKPYYNVFLIDRYSDPAPGFDGKFSATNKTRAIGNFAVNAEVITVDSTIGFPKSGLLISGNNIITYTDKTINQFLNCSGITEEIQTTDEIRTNDIAYAFNDDGERVELKITGVISKFNRKGSIFYNDEDEVFRVQTIGKKIKNPIKNKSIEEIKFNSWDYNTAVTINVKSFSGSTFVLDQTIDKAFLKNNDEVEILNGGNNEILISSASVTVSASNVVILAGSGISNLVQGISYKIRRKQKKSTSTGIELEFGNNILTSDIQNTYISSDDSNLYAASSSLPSFNIEVDYTQVELTNISPLNGTIQDLDSNTNDTYNTLSFSDNLPFITGDEVIYSVDPGQNPIEGLEDGRKYYVKVINYSNKLRLYLARSFVDQNKNIKIKVPSNAVGAHKFTLSEQYNKKIAPQKILKKFPIQPRVDTGAKFSTVPGSTGILKNGVEIVNYKTDDKVYFGPLESIFVVSSGTGYDVSNPPAVRISAPNVSGATTALANLAVRGSLETVLIDSQDFNIENVFGIEIKGGNGSGALVEPVVVDSFRSVSFKSQLEENDGGVGFGEDSKIQTISNHNFGSGEVVVYDPAGNAPIPVASGFGATITTGKFLETGGVYYTEILSPTTFRLYETLNDLNSGINTVGFTTGNYGGRQSFRLLRPTKKIIGVNVLDSGSGYENRKVSIQTTGISTVSNTLEFKNHGFSTGELITYTPTGTPLTGISTSNQYFVIKVNDDKFRIAFAGVGGTDRTNFDRSLTEKFENIGSGYHEFNYPPITVDVNVSIANTVGVVTATAIVKGSIVNTLLYEKGSSYGSDILNFEKNPTVDILNGKGAELEPSIINGRINSVIVKEGGKEYFSVPDIIAEDLKGTGAIFRAIIKNQKIDSIAVINGGIGYDSDTTRVVAIPRGNRGFIAPKIRSLTINRNYKFKNDLGVSLLNKGDDVGLQYGVGGYTSKLATEFEDTDETSHSPLIGWAYDGNPIYGIYGYVDPNDSVSDIREIVSGYQIDISRVGNRPIGFPQGIFVEDYYFVGNGDLDESNGRFAKTPEFPKGTYVYYATKSTNPLSGDLEPSFPYFIGDSYRSNVVVENLSGQEESLSQEFDFNNSGVLRNTYPYAVSEENADYDFFVEPYELENQRIVVDQINSGGIESVVIVESGDDYKVGDKIDFNNEETNGGGASAEVSELKGKPVDTLVESTLTYKDIVFERTDVDKITGVIGTFHQYSTGEIISISGLSTFISGLADSHEISVPTEFTKLKTSMPNEPFGGIVTDITVSPIPEFLRPDGRVSIGTVGNREELTVLNVYKPNTVANRFIGVVRAIRGTTSIGHTIGAPVNLRPNSFEISLAGDGFVSNKKEIAYFNPKETVGLGTIAGLTTTREYTVSGFTTERDILSKSIHIQDHKFNTNQKAIFEKLSTTLPLIVSSNVGLTTFSLPADGTDSQIVYLTDKGKNLIGIKTEINGEELAFHNFGSDNYQYKLTTQPLQVRGDVSRLSATINGASRHGLSLGDDVTLQVKPNLTVGIGTSTEIRVQFQEDIQNIIIDPVGFTSSSVGISSSKFTINNHGFETGDLVYYNSSELPAGFSTGKYFVYSIDKNNFSLVETKKDLEGKTIKTVSFTSIGGTSHTIAKINPNLRIVRNNNIKFDLSHQSLFNYDFDLYLDQSFRTEFIGTGNTDIFQVTRNGTVGLGTTATFTVQFTEDLPNELFYNIKKGDLIEPDFASKNYSKISFIDSNYNIKTKVIGAAASTTSFTVSLQQTPERVSYAKTECEVLSYTTRSKTSNGGISNVRILSAGDSYKRIPGITSIRSEEGVNAEVFAESKTIGALQSVVIEKPGFDFSQDKTLKPVADIPTYYDVSNSNKVKEIKTVYGGQNFITPPDLVLVNSVTKTEVEDAEIIAKLSSGSIETVEIVSTPSGLAGVGHSVYSISNSNGISITEVDSVNTGIVTVTLRTPVLGFTTSPFKAGDKIFIDGLQTFGSVGDGFNSKDYGFTFFEVQSFNGGINPSTLTYSLQDFTTNAGIAVTDVIFGNVSKFENYPTFEVSIEPDNFTINERLQVKTPLSANFVDTDLIVTKSEGNVLKTFGDYVLESGDRIFGSVSGTRANIKNINRFEGSYDVDYGINQNFGWDDEIGFLNTDYQVIPDNDYYQKLSYSISSPLEFTEFSGPVNRLTHIAGTKNFANTLIESVGVIPDYKDTTTQNIILDYISETNTTTLRNFDFAVDTDVAEGTTSSIKFGSKKLSSYIECITNRVLTIDDISTEFVDSENLQGSFKDILVFPPIAGTSKLYILVTDVLDPTHYEIHEVIVTNDGNENSFILEKSRIKSSGVLPLIPEEEETIGEITSIYDSISIDLKVRFTPSNPTKTYNIKVFRQLFDSRTSGIGSFSVGDTELFGITKPVLTGITTTIIGVGSSEYDALMVYAEIKNTTTNELSYSELTVINDGTNVHMSEYGFSSDDRERLSFGAIGTFGAYLKTDVVANDTLAIDFHNNTAQTTQIKFNVVGLQNSNVGLSSYHIKLAGQDDGSERTARVESNKIEETSAGYGITVVGLSTLIDRYAKSVVRVAIGETISMSQVLFSQDNGLVDTMILEYAQTGVNTPIGLGTFSGEFNGPFANLLFIPDSKYNGENIKISQYSEIIYKEQDTNIAAIPDFPYGVSINDLAQAVYTPNDKLDFDLKHNGDLIFARSFNPTNSSILDLSTGELNIPNHFLFNTQEIIYTAASSIIGVNSESIGIANTLAGGSEFIGDSVINSKIVSAASTDLNINVGDEIIGVTVSTGTTIVSIGSSFRFFFGDTDGGKIISGVANTSVLAIGDTIRELDTETGFGTITSIGINSITVDNNLPVGVGSTYYSERLGIAVSMSQVALASTVGQNYTTGISTNILPSQLFAIVVDPNTIKFATKKDFAARKIGAAITATGGGNAHTIETTKKLSKTFITIDGIIQDPVSSTNIVYQTKEEVGSSRTFFAISGISTIVPGDLLKIDDEFMKVRNIGAASSNVGPISGVGTFNVVNVDRAALGTKVVDLYSHGADVELFRGAYNIIQSTIHFTDPPKGAGADFLTDDRNLFYTRSSFSGRVYLKQDYSLNEIYDDVSTQFTGIAQTFRLTSGGNRPVGLETASGSGVVFINGIHQGQTTDNNPLNVYSLETDSEGVNLQFSGTKLITGDPYLSFDDVNANQLPKGGIIVSLAYTGGTGIAPLVGAKVIVDVDASGSITTVVGVETVGTYSTITNFDYTQSSGIGTVTTENAHGFKIGDFVSMRDIEFDCTSGYDSLVGVSALDYDNVSGIMTVTTKTDHFLNKDMEVKFRDLKFECTKGFDNLLGVSTASYDHLSGIITVTTSSAHDLNRNMKVKFHDLKFECTKEFLPTVGIYTADYDNVSGIITVSTIGDHELNRNMKVKFYDLEMECQKGFDTQLGISSTEYDHVSGILTVTTSTNHLLNKGMSLRLADLEFACTEEHAGVTTTIFPDGTNGRIFNTVESTLSATQFTTQVGITTIPHIPIGGGTVETGITTTKFPSKAGIQYGITGFDYTESTGVGTITVNRNHNITIGETVDIRNIEFTCDVEHAGVTTTTFPDGTQGFEYEVLSVPSATELKVNVGISTIAHTYDSGGFVSGVKYLEGYTVTNVGSGTEFTAQIDTVGFAHTYVSGGLVQSGVTTNVFPSSEGKQFAIVNFEYTENSGSSIITLSGNHEISVGTDIKLEDIEFICSSEHAGVTTTIFPDGTQGDTFKVTGVGASTINVNVGISTIAHTYSAHGILSEVQYDEGFNVTKVNSTTEFEAQIPTVGFAHTYIAYSGGNVETGITTNVFPSDLGIEWAISGFDYTEATGVSTIATRKTHNITTGEFVRLKDIEFTCSSEHSGVTTTIFPDTIIDEFEVLDVPSGTEIKINVGPSTIAHTYSANGVAQGVKFVGGYKVGKVIDSKNFSVNALPVGFAHTYVAHSGGVVETGFTTTRFPDNRGIPFAISNFEYDKTTGFSTITTKKNYSGLAIGDVINLSGIAMTCLAYGNEIAIYDFDYTASTGVSTILTADNHGLSDGDLVMLRDIEFSCAAPHAGVTTTIFPDGTQGFYFNVNAGSSGTSIVTNVGISTIAHDYVSGTGKVRIGITTSIFPDGTQGSEFKIFGLPAPNQIITNVGVSTIDHIYDDHGVVFGVKYANPYSIRTIIDDNKFEVDVLKVGFAHTYVPSRRRGVPSGEAAEYYSGLTFGSGYFGAINVDIEEVGHEGTNASITATAGLGGTAIFSITNAGTGYTSPTINIEDPNYSEMPVVGVSRVAVGETTDSGFAAKLNVIVSASTTTGIGSTVFEASGFRLADTGFGFRRGDKFKPVGLVTATGVGTIFTDMIFEVTEISNDTFSSWNFGQVDYIDSISSLQNGVRTRFPLNLNGASLSFQKDEQNPQSALIDLDAVLLVFVNGVIQTPGKDYFFSGGTSFNFNFTAAPLKSDNIAIYFYRGTKDVDSKIVTVFESLKAGDILRLKGDRPSSIFEQNDRVLSAIVESEKVETNIYRNQGINENIFRPIDVTKQKRDLVIFEEKITKIRDSLEAQIMPVAKVIKNFSSSDTEIFLDNADFFQYEENAPGANLAEVVCDADIIGYQNVVAAAATATVSAAGTISEITIVNGGSGYPDGAIEIKIQAPKKVDNSLFNIIGIGGTAELTGTASGGQLTSVTIDEPGFGYTHTNVPQVIVELAKPIKDTIKEAEVILGYSGIITGIGTTTGISGHPLAMKFELDLSKSGSPALLQTLLVGYPIVVQNTTVVGTGITSVDSSDSEIVGISTIVDNIYYVSSISFNGNVGVITSNIKSDTITSGISSNGDYVGEFSWGKLSSFNRVEGALSFEPNGNTYDVGLSTYPTVTRKGFGLRNTGNISKKVFI